VLPHRGEWYKDFPPRWGHLRVPTSSRKAATAAIALYAPCRPRAFLVQRAAWMITRLVGPRALPGRTVRWVPDVPPDVWHEISVRIQATVGSFDTIAGYERLQADRPGFALLLLGNGAPVAFVKVRGGDVAPIDTERTAVDMVWRHGPRSFCVPRPLASGFVDRWAYLVVEALAPRLHRPARNPRLGAITSEVQAALASLPRPTGTSPHWRPMHGDFAPWNLRRTGPGEPVLIDWEDAAWGPPGADEVFYRATQDALGIDRARGSPYEEAIDFWLDRVERWGDSDRDRRLGVATAAALRRMRAVREMAPCA
jgi:phosphotransferase family enzyme